IQIKDSDFSRIEAALFSRIKMLMGVGGSGLDLKVIRSFAKGLLYYPGNKISALAAKVCVLTGTYETGFHETLNILKTAFEEQRYRDYDFRQTIYNAYYDAKKSMEFR